MLVPLGYVQAYFMAKLFKPAVQQSCEAVSMVHSKLTVGYTHYTVLQAQLYAAILFQGQTARKVLLNTLELWVPVLKHRQHH